jgi:hypothetical protein
MEKTNEKVYGIDDRPVTYERMVQDGKKLLERVKFHKPNPRPKEQNEI